MSGDDLGQWPGRLSVGSVEEPFRGIAPSVNGDRVVPVGAGSRREALRRLPGLSASLRVKTAEGDRRIDQLMPGEYVLTRDRGYQPLCCRVQVAPREVHPVLRSPIPMVRIAAGALGRGLPAEDIVVSSAQRIMLATPRAEVLFGAEEVLVAAQDLRHLDGVTSAPHDAQEHVVLLFDTHEVILAEGLWTESLLPEPDVLEALPVDQRTALRTAQPRLCHATGRAAYMPARMVLNAREARLLSVF